MPEHDEAANEGYLLVGTVLSRAFCNETCHRPVMHGAG